MTSILLEKMAPITHAHLKKKICPQYIFPTFSLLISPSSRKRHKFILERTGHNYIYVGGPKPAKVVVNILRTIGSII